VKIIILLLFVFSTSVDAAYCTSQTGVIGSDGRPFSQFYTDGLPSMELCSDFILLTAVEYSIINEKAKMIDNVDSLSVEGVTIAFSFGMSTYALFWFVGFKGRLARQAIRSI